MVFTFVADVGLAASLQVCDERKHSHAWAGRFRTEINACGAFLLTQLIIGRDSWDRYGAYTLRETFSLFNFYVYYPIAKSSFNVHAANSCQRNLYGNARERRTMAACAEKPATGATFRTSMKLAYGASTAHRMAAKNNVLPLRQLHIRTTSCASKSSRGVLRT